LKLPGASSGPPEVERIPVRGKPVRTSKEISGKRMLKAQIKSLENNVFRPDFK
jgi:hypothetical protein